jgi:hypothetical protein
MRWFIDLAVTLNEPRRLMVQMRESPESIMKQALFGTALYMLANPNRVITNEGFELLNSLPRPLVVMEIDFWIAERIGILTLVPGLKHSDTAALD